MHTAVMPYDRDTSHISVGPSLYVFEDDGQVSTSAYKAVMTNAYLRKLPLAPLLAQRFGLPYSDEDYERAKRLLISMGWLDHFIDEAPDRQMALAIFNDLMRSLLSEKPVPTTPGWVRPELRDSIILLRNAMRILPKAYRSSVVRKAQRVGAISQEKARITSVATYASTLAEEGALTANLMVECLSPAVRASTGYKRMYQWTERAITAVTLLDAGLDIRDDFADGLTQVPPALGNRIYLYRRATAYVPSIVRGLGFRGVLVLLRVGLN